MAKKIKGFGEPDIDFHPMRLAASITVRANANPGDVPCAIVIGESNVFTESEVRAAAMAEPELPDTMPDEMWEACKSDRETMEEAMRVVVRLTRDGILGRLLAPPNP